MIDWIIQIWESVTTVIDLTGTYLESLVTHIDEIVYTVTAMQTLFGFIGAVRYFVGDTIFFLLTKTILIGSLLTIYKLLVLVIQVITPFIPGMKGKIAIR